MKRNNRKGFTMVELVVVVAVIAILAAVLIPTFVNMINKANISADTQIVKNMNIALASEEALDGKKNETMYDALEDVKENGFVVENLTPTSEGNDIVWDSENDRFAILDEAGEIIYAETESINKEAAFVVLHNGEALSTKYSSYLADDYYEEESASAEYEYAYADSGKKLDATLGIDVGNNEGVEITYGGEDGMIIRTTATCTLTVTGGSVKHYGKVLSLTVEGGTYTEYGNATTAKISGGTVTLENGAKFEVAYGTFTNNGGTVGATYTSKDEFETAATEAQESAKNEALSLNYVARIGTTGYESLQAAVDAANTAGSTEVTTINVISNGTETTAITATAPVEIIFNSDYTLTSLTFNSASNINILTVNEGITLTTTTTTDEKTGAITVGSGTELTVNGKGKIVYTENTANVIYVAAGTETKRSKLTIEDITLNGNGTSETACVYIKKYCDVSIKSVGMIDETGYGVITKKAESSSIKLENVNIKAKYGISVSGKNSTSEIKNCTVSTEGGVALSFSTGTHTVDGGSFKADWAGVETESFTSGNAVNIRGGTVTFKGDVKVSSVRGNKRTIDEKFESRAILIIQGTVNIESGEFSSLGQECIYIKNALYKDNTNKVTLNISGGTFKITAPDETNGTDLVINVVDKAQNVTVIITGGTFYGFDPSKAENNTANLGENSKWTASGYTVK